MPIPGTSPAPANTPSAFNTTVFGETRLDAQILQSTSFRVGIADYRGDGRPDYHYNARVLYGDRLSPGRASVAGGTPLTIAGLGLQANTSVQIGMQAAPVLASSATQLLVDSKARAGWNLQRAVAGCQLRRKLDNDECSNRRRRPERHHQDDLGRESRHAGWRNGTFAFFSSRAGSRRRHAGRRRQCAVQFVSVRRIVGVCRRCKLHRAHRPERSMHPRT